MEMRPTTWENGQQEMKRRSIDEFQTLAPE